MKGEQQLLLTKINTIFIAGFKEKIKVFQLKEGKPNQIEVLNGHQDTVTALKFMKNTNNFVSGSYKSIIIWLVNGNNQWYRYQKLNEHQNFIWSLLLRNNDDLIISGSWDTTIKFWIKQNQWVCQKTIYDHTNSVCSLSLNESQNKLISCSNDLLILVIEYSYSNKKWIVIQKIKGEQGAKLCFINDYQFTFQTLSQRMYANYRMTKVIAVNCSSDKCSIFPQQYFKSKCLLLNKNGKYINLIRKKENGEFQIQQAIEFGHHTLYGRLSDNGKYLITWDFASQEFQIRKFKEI